MIRHLFSIHRMWRAIPVSLALLALVTFARPARADATLLSVSADLPVKMSITANTGGGATTYDASSVSGIGLSLSLPVLIGFGFETYTGNFSKSGTKFNYGVRMYDILFNLPVPVVNIAIGAGFGTGSFSDATISGVPVSSPWKDADLTQWFASLGVPILPLVDVHVGYHAFSGTNKSNSALVPNANVNGDMWSLGTKIGF